MSNYKPIVVRTLPAALALGLVISGSPTLALSAEVAHAAAPVTPDVVVPVVAPVVEPTVAPAAVAPAEKSVALVDGRVLAIGLGAIGGVATYCFVTGNWWGMGAGAMRFAQAGMPGAAMAAARLGGGAWGVPWIFSSASGLAGALVGDWIYRSNHTAE